LRPATTRAGFAARASNRSQSLAGIETIRRSITSTSAASRAFRRTKSLTFVRACEDAASSSLRSSSLNRTLNTDEDMEAVPDVNHCMTMERCELAMSRMTKVATYRIMMATAAIVAASVSLSFYHPHHRHSLPSGGKLPDVRGRADPGTGEPGCAWAVRAAWEAGRFSHAIAPLPLARRSHDLGSQA
jgi:hypothetical protein